MATVLDRVQTVVADKLGVDKAVKAPPDLVVLDLVLPGIGGIDVCQALKQNQKTAGVPILILTGEDKNGQEITLLDMGADDYLTKPVKMERLLARSSRRMPSECGHPAPTYSSQGCCGSGNFGLPFSSPPSAR